MASFNTSGFYGSHWWGDVDPWVNWQNASTNQSRVHVRLIMRADPGYSQAANTSYNVRINGGVIASGSRSVSLNGNSTVLIEGDVTVNHDVNGNWSGSFGGSLSSGYSGVGSGGADWAWSIPRLALPPTITSIIADTIKPTSARLGVEISSHGRGTSTNFEMFYRLLGSGSWISLGVQGDVGGYNYWTASGLSPGKTYQYVCNAVNNNGDFAQSSVNTFTTTPVSGMITVIKGLI